MYEGKIIARSKKFITGWIKNSNNKDSVSLKVISQNRTIRILNAQRILKFDDQSQIGPYGFRFSIRDLIRDGAKNEIIIKTLDGSFTFDAIKILDINHYSMKKINFNKRQISRPNIFLIAGKPNSGKSTFAKAFSEIIGKTHLMSLDDIFRNDKYPEDASSKIMGYVESPMFNNEDFLQLFADEYLPKVDFKNNHTIVIEGWLLGFEKLRKKITQLINIYGMPFYLELDNHQLKFRNKTFDGTHAENAKSFFKLYQKLRLDELTKKTTYQFYEDLGQKARNSNSAEKIKKANIPDISNKVVLDIGCNAGFMSNSFARNGAAYVYGIDVRRVSVSVASQYNNIYYQSDNVKFYHIDVYDFYPDKKLDLVYASSVFHYFRNKQDLFFEHMHNLMNKNGLMVIEIEMFEEKAEEPFTYKYKRSVDDTPCHFPNQLMLDKMIKDKFDVDSKVLSVNQKGSKLNRYFFHLKKI